MNESILLAKASSCRIYENGKFIELRSEPSSWLSTARFVFALLTFIPTIAGLAMLVGYIRGTEELFAASLVLILLGCLFGFVSWFLLQKHRKVKTLKPNEMELLCSFDLNKRQLLNSKGEILDLLDKMRIEKSYQMTSSSKKLLVKWSTGSLVVAYGNPFSGGIDPLIRLLQEKGLMD